MLAVVWPFGFPARFADSGSAQTRCAQPMRAFFPESPALLGPTTRPEETAETMSPLLRADQLAALRQGPPNTEGIRPDGRKAGVGSQQRRHADKKALEIFWNSSNEKDLPCGCDAFLKKLKRKRRECSNTDRKGGLRFMEIKGSVPFSSAAHFRVRIGVPC